LPNPAYLLGIMQNGYYLYNCPSGTCPALNTSSCSSALTQILNYLNSLGAGLFTGNCSGNILTIYPPDGVTCIYITDDPNLNTNTIPTPCGCFSQIEPPATGCYSPVQGCKYICDTTYTTCIDSCNGIIFMDTLGVLASPFNFDCSSSGDSIRIQILHFLNQNYFNRQKPFNIIITDSATGTIVRNFYTNNVDTIIKNLVVNKTYIVTVIDSFNCIAKDTVRLIPGNKPELTSTQVNTTCGLCNGSIDVSVSGGTSPYTYDWTDLVGTNDPQDRSSLCSGTYTVYVTDAQGCKDTLTVTIAASSKPELTSTQVNTTCGLCNGSIDVSVSGGTSPYTYDWTDLVGTNDPQDRSSLCSGTYTVYVTDAQGCKDTLTVTISDIGGPSVTETHTNVTCFSGNDGSIDISVSGGTSPYTYDWTDLVGTNDPQDRTNLTAGTYTVTVTDANGCKTTLSITISQPTKVDATSTQVNTTCGLCNGSIDVSVSGGTSPYTYDWTDLVGTNDPQDRSSLCSGTYTVYVTDAQGCKDTLTVTISDIGGPSVTETHTNVTCFSGNDGSIDVSVSGGTSPYTYDWTDLVGTNDPQDRTNLTAGTYTVTVTDANGCKTTLSITISQPTKVNATSTQVNTTCGLCNGSIDVSVSGGTSPYTYDWTDLVGTNDPQDRSSLCSGTYTVYVTDAQGCKDTLTVTISDIGGPSVTETHTNVTCFSGNDGSIDISVSGGTSPYTYDWTDLVGTNDPQDRTNLTAGTYTVTVTDANGCKTTLSITISQPTKVNATSTQVNTTCGLCNGSIDVSVSGGTSPYTYDWTDLVGTNDPQDRSSLCSGTYTVYVTDAQGCKDTLTVTIAASSKPELTSTQVNTTCGLCNGSIDVSVSGGTSPYTYDWTDLVGTNDPQDRSSLCSGTYTVYVTDAQGCKDTLTVSY
jgi:transcription elongation factor Elf1